MLQPANTWCWQLSKDSESRLLLDLDNEMVFETPYREKQLNKEIIDSTPFNIDDASFYIGMSQYLSDLNRWGEPHIAQIMLNAVAVKRFYKPMLPKSWFFKQNQQAMSAIEPVIRLYSDVDSAEFLIVEDCGNAVLCILIEAQCFLDNEGTALNQFDAIKVMKDRIFDCHAGVLGNPGYRQQA